MLGNLLNFGKKKNFYLELKENDNTGIVEKVESVATQVQEETKQVVKGVKEAVTDSSIVSEIKSEAQEIAEDITNKVEQTSSKKPKASAKAKNSKKAATTQTAPAPKVINTSYSDEPFWVKLMYKTSEQKAAESNGEKTFATDYLIDKPKPRRRPGGSVDQFKTMARQTKVRF